MRPGRGLGQGNRINLSEYSANLTEAVRMENRVVGTAMPPGNIGPSRLSGVCCCTPALPLTIHSVWRWKIENSFSGWRLDAGAPGAGVGLIVDPSGDDLRKDGEHPRAHGMSSRDFGSSAMAPMSCSPNNRLIP